MYKAALTTFILLFPLISKADWNVDFTRRSEQMGSSTPELNDTTRGPASVLQQSATQSMNESKSKSIIERVFDTTTPTQDIVVINTETGFIPSTVRVKEGAQYRLVIVNVNEKAKNISFVLDAFSEHHATFYGQLKTFYITPKKEGVYSFVSPETAAQGKLVVYPAGPTPNRDMPSAPTLPMPTTEMSDLNIRTPASE
ncbi:MAG: cupredoxin domain-containing protein [Bdellovibrionales bacterium]